MLHSFPRMHIYALFALIHEREPSVYDSPAAILFVVPASMTFGNRVFLKVMLEEYDVQIQRASK